MRSRDVDLSNMIGGLQWWYTVRSKFKQGTIKAASKIFGRTWFKERIINIYMNSTRVRDVELVRGTFYICSAHVRSKLKNTPYNKGAWCMRPMVGWKADHLYSDFCSRSTSMEGITFNETWNRIFHVMIKASIPTGSWISNEKAESSQRG